jgi:hypothetical protein
MPFVVFQANLMDAFAGFRPDWSAMLFLTITASRLDREPFVQMKLSPKSHSDFRLPRSIDDAPSPPSQQGSLLKRFSASSQCWTSMRNPRPSAF